VPIAHAVIAAAFLDPFEAAVHGPTHTNAVFPTAVSPKYANLPAGRARMLTCLDQYKANKADNMSLMDERGVNKFTRQMRTRDIIGSRYQRFARRESLRSQLRKW
jgi:hypothetical protein